MKQKIIELIEIAGYIVAIIAALELIRFIIWMAYYSGVTM